jgi:two-component system, NtrC family, sensor kinase
MNGIPTKELNQLNEFLFTLHEMSSFDELFEAIIGFTKYFFNLQYCIYWDYKQSSNSLVYRLGIFPTEEVKNNFLSNGFTELKLEEQSTHSLAIEKKKSIFLRKITKKNEYNSKEIKNQEILNIHSLLLNPIFLKGNLIGVLDFSNAREKIILSKNQFYYISIFCKYLGGTLKLFKTNYELEQEKNLAKASQKKVEELKEKLKVQNQLLEIQNDRVTKAYFDLEESQKQLIQSDKMITLGTMVAGVAHEINTPLSAIKANSENISQNIKDLITKLNQKNYNLSQSDIENITYIINLSNILPNSISTKEMRTIKKRILSLLEDILKENIDIIADYIFELGLIEALENKDQILQHPSIVTYLSITNELLGIKKKSILIYESAQRVSKIVKSLKSFVHFEQREEMTLSSITDGIETILIVLNNKIKYGIKITKNYEDLPMVYCYPDELNQIWTNLIHNAIQAMNEKGDIMIDLKKLNELPAKLDIDKIDLNFKGDYFSVSIEDTGSGIPPEVRPKIFEAFFTTKPAGEGSGLGLHIVGKILEKHSGGLVLESQPGKTRFTVILPLKIDLR